MILIHNHRQGARQEWANVLNRFRLGIVTDEDFELINPYPVEGVFFKKQKI